MPPTALRALLAELIDYAGLFPPAALPLADVQQRYDAYRRSPDAWALGPLVVPAARLAELAALIGDGAKDALPVSALIGDDVAQDAESVRNANASGRIAVRSVEARASSLDVMGAVTNAFAKDVVVYLEIPVAEDPREHVVAIRQCGARAKIRTGGVTPDAFPTAAHCARFIARCAELDVAFKATAGLHHPLRGAFRLTYADDAPRGTMFGFLNVFAAGVFARGSMPETALAELLDERDVTAFRFTDDAVHWRAHSISLDDVIAARATFAMSFGSCSFREPIDDLHQLGLL
ncbi:MAG: hypothetical protein ABI625_23560 [bacterium]